MLLRVNNLSIKILMLIGMLMCLCASARPVRILIDPGHGGRDPGATSILGYHEKTLTLLFSQSLYKALLKSDRLEPMLLRSSDHSISLSERLATVRQSQADLLLSVHMDTFSDQSVRGISIYRLKHHCQDDDSGDFSMDQHRMAPKYKNLILYLNQHGLSTRRLILAETLLTRLSKKQVRLHQYRAIPRCLRILKSSIPSVLIEIGFASNVDDVRYILNPVTRSILIKHLVQGLEDYALTLQ